MRALGNVMLIQPIVPSVLQSPRSSAGSGPQTTDARRNQAIVKLFALRLIQPALHLQRRPPPGEFVRDVGVEEKAFHNSTGGRMSGNRSKSISGFKRGFGEQLRQTLFLSVPLDFDGGRVRSRRLSLCHYSSPKRCVPLPVAKAIKFRPQITLASCLSPPGPVQCVSRLIQPLKPSAASARIWSFQSM